MAYVLRQMYNRYKETLSNYAVDLDFYWFLSSQPSSSKQGVCQAPSGCCTGEARTNPPSEKQLFFYSFAGLKCTVTIETTLPQYGICKENSPQFWCNSFFLSKCSRKNQTRVWLKCYLLYKMHSKNLWFVLLKNKFMLSRIHINGGSSIAGLGKMRGGGFVFFKALPLSIYLLAWLRCLLSLTTLQFQRFCFPFLILS